MYEIHGWMVIRESTTDVDVGGLADIVSAIKAMVDRFDHNPSVTFLEPNGMSTLNVTGMFNHADSRVGRVSELVLEVCRIAPGSYGLFHIWDDESTDENRFVVVVVRRGDVQIHSDALLSPCRPVIEDP